MLISRWVAVVAVALTSVAVAETALGSEGARDVAIVTEAPQRQWSVGVVPFQGDPRVAENAIAQAVTVPIAGGLVSVAAVVGDALVWKSSDGIGGLVLIGSVGEQVVPSSLVQFGEVLVLAARDSDDVFTVFSSEDGGQSWMEHSGSHFDEAPAAAQLLVVDDVLLITSPPGFIEDAPVLRTTDLSTWSELSMPGLSNILLSDGDLLFALQGDVDAGAESEVWSSTDGGAAFAQEDGLVAPLGSLVVANGRLLAVDGAAGTRWLDVGSEWAMQPADPDVFGNHGFLTIFPAITRAANGTIMFEVVRDCPVDEDCEATSDLIETTDGVTWSVVSPAPPGLLLRFKQRADIIVQPDGSIYSWSRSATAGATDQLLVHRLIRDLE